MSTKELCPRCKQLHAPWKPCADRAPAPSSPPTFTERLDAAAAVLASNGTPRRSEVAALVADGQRTNRELARAEAVIAAVREMYAAWPSLLGPDPLPDALAFRAWIHEHAHRRLARALNFYAAGGGLA